MQLPGSIFIEHRAAGSKLILNGLWRHMNANFQDKKPGIDGIPFV